MTVIMVTILPSLQNFNRHFDGSLATRYLATMPRRCLLLLLPAWISAVDLTVETKWGPVIGKRVTTSDGDVHVWHGVPFAAPPVGDLRFRAPVDPARWLLPRLALNPLETCPQIKVQAACKMM